jgi:hypothetical protein
MSLQRNQLDKYENIIIQKGDQNEVHRIQLPEVIDYFITSHDNWAKEIINETFNLYNQSQLMRKMVAEDYNMIEKNYLEQEMHLENLKNMKNTREKNLIKNGFLF